MACPGDPQLPERAQVQCLVVDAPDWMLRVEGVKQFLSDWGEGLSGSRAKVERDGGHRGAEPAGGGACVLHDWQPGLTPAAPLPSPSVSTHRRPSRRGLCRDSPPR